MSLITPPRNELVHFVLSRRADTTRDVHTAIKTQLNVAQSIRKIRQEGGPNSVLVKATEHGPSERDAVNDLFTLGVVAGLEADDGLNAIATATEWENPTLIIRFYDRDPNTIHWYYEVYADGQAKATGASVNGFMSTLSNKTVYGAALVVKNGPKDHGFDTTIDVVALTKTLWFYFRSGSSMDTIAGERSFERLLVSNF
ncbi:hypothetical protein B0H11DRAFT_2239517 [Mycena galericulata]|nr:hypothetical protein B0H11DRAFT_2254095 [Mycena galericulata]KAJ7442829.1 hypothetical protein B0H11DRAFT_2251289 [Mycena galericulata]KAJ7467276.1 hypothetical protein B0H11DRAFT_2239517 [Mycena galericulata]